MTTRQLRILLIAALLCFMAAVVYRHSAPIPQYTVTQAEGFAAAAERPGAEFGTLGESRFWTSRPGDRGTLRIGPFPAPERLILALSGSPGATGTELFLEMPMLGLRWPLAAGNVGDQWKRVEFEIPEGWQGWQVNLVAVDNSNSTAEWLGVSEPLEPASGRMLESGFVATLLAWLCNGCLLAFPFCAALVRLHAVRELPDVWRPLLAGAVTAALGYLCFWAWFIHPTLGLVISVGIPACALADLLHSRGTAAEKLGAQFSIVALMLVVGLLYVSALHLFEAQRGFYDLAANRFVEGLPGDNRLSRDLAYRLYHATTLKNWGDWLSSDRPPLESGWELLTWPYVRSLGFGSIVGTGTAAVWLQLLWVPAVYGLLRTLNLGEAKALGWTAVVSLSGFFLLNTLFTWPKLAAASFASAAFVLWTLPWSERPGRARLAFGALLAALGWLAHGGVAFAFIAAAPVFAWRFWRADRRDGLVAIVVFLTAVVPWSAYQRFYDPPGDRLLKWHLAGVESKDDRGVLTALADGYRSLAAGEVLSRKAQNLRALIGGDWRGLFDFAARQDAAALRRRDEFFHMARALTWWSFALAVLPFLPAIRRAAMTKAEGRRAAAWLAAWVTATLIVWCVLMFNGGSTVIHQGSYTTMLVLFALGSAAFAAAGRFSIIVVTVLQTATLATTWLVRSGMISGPADRSALACLVAALCGVAWFVARSTRTEPEAQPLA